jgi:hypothetical protein
VPGELATGYGLWVRSIRTAEGAIPFPTPDELIVTAITHDHADRVRSYRLLAEEWARR